MRLADLAVGVLAAFAVALALAMFALLVWALPADYL